MKLYLFILSLLLTVACNSNKTDKTYSAITYNIRYDNPDDNTDNWHHRKTELIAQIQELKPDILGTQEALVHQVTYLDSMLTNYNYVGIGREDGKTKGEYAALFYNKDKWSCLQNKTFWLSETPDTISVGWDAALERICTYALLENKKTGKKLWVLNIHFDHQGTKARQKSAALLIAKITDLQKEKPAPAILMGDFNATPQDSPIKLLSQTFYNSGKLIEYAATFNAFDLKSAPQYCIDYIFTTDLAVKQCKVLKKKRKNGHYISDHFPIIIRFSLMRN